MSEYEQRQQQEGEDIGKELERMLGGFPAAKYEVAAKYLVERAHRTGQQGVMRFFVLFCKALAENGRCDDRNRASVELAKEVVKLPARTLALPLV